MKFTTRICLLFVLLTILCGLATCGLTGCEILKSKRSAISDSTSVKKKIEATNTDISGGVVSKDESKSKGEYERTTYIYPKRDTNVFNFYNQPPSTIIYEKGKIEQSSSKTDSGWYKLMEQRMKALSDSLNKKKSEEDKEVNSKTKGVGLWSIVMIVIAGWIIVQLLGYGLKNFKISRT